MISVKNFKEQVINNQESLNRMLRVLPHMIQQEIELDLPKSPKIIKDLQKRLDICREIYAIRKLQGDC
jgi:predicted outer membrane protein|tara:strand:- start:84 stop:287 length:204 start_codon:yes stop_codon:yes gene_type:complete